MAIELIDGKVYFGPHNERRRLDRVTTKRAYYVNPTTGEKGFCSLGQFRAFAGESDRRTLRGSDGSMRTIVGRPELPIEGAEPVDGAVPTAAFVEYVTPDAPFTPVRVSEAEWTAWAEGAE